MEFQFKEVKAEYVELYSDQTFSKDFESFDDAFKAAWDSFDYIAGAETIEQFCEGMTNCWQLQDT